jgi:hypothetical protein
MPRVVVVKVIIMVVRSGRYDSGECNFFDRPAAVHVTWRQPDSQASFPPTLDVGLPARRWSCNASR